MKMLTIGQFSKICMVTVKTLRHYEKIGLLRPAEVNETNGYRFYSEEQIPGMLFINRLKLYGFSLSDIKDVLSCADTGEVLQRLKKQKCALEQSVRETNAVLDELDRHINNLERTGNIMSYQNDYTVMIENTKEFDAISVRCMMGVDEFGKYYGTLYKRCADEDIVLTGICAAMYHDKEFDPQSSDIELLLGVSDSAKADKKAGGGMCAVTTHYGGYSGLPDAYGALTKWISENGYTPAGAPYEIYIKTQFDRIPVSEWETKIFFPIKTA